MAPTCQVHWCGGQAGAKRGGGKERKRKERKEERKKMAPTHLPRRSVGGKPGPWIQMTQCISTRTCKKKLKIPAKTSQETRGVCTYICARPARPRKFSLPQFEGGGERYSLPNTFFPLPPTFGVERAVARRGTVCFRVQNDARPPKI